MKNLNWIDSLVAECSHVETPANWLWFSYLACISAAAGNNYSLVTLKGDLIYKPNLYIMLLGESGLGKGFPVNRAAMLVQKANVTRVIKGRSSIQAIVTDLSQTKTQEGKPLIQDSRAFIVNGELSTAIIQDPDSLTILTDLFDGHYNPEWTNLLKGSGAEKLKNPYITALFGSSPAHFYDSIPQANIDGGYIGRNLIVFEEKRSQDVDLLDLDDSSKSDTKFDDYLAPKFVPHLENIAKKKGQMHHSDDAKKYYNTWRREWRGKQVHDKTGFLNRVPDHVMKVSMCLSLAEDDFNGIIELAHVEEAVLRITGLVYANKRTTEGRGPDPLAAASKMVLDFLIAADNQQLTRKRLLQKGYGSFNAYMLDQLIENLVEMGWVRKTKSGVGDNIDHMIHLSGEPLEELKKHLKSRKK